MLLDTNAAMLFSAATARNVSLASAAYMDALLAARPAVLVLTDVEMSPFSETLRCCSRPARHDSGTATRTTHL